MVALALLTGACQTRDPYVTGTVKRADGGAWRVETTQDRVTGERHPSAYVMAMASSSKVDYPKLSALELSCFAGDPIVRLAFRFKVGSSRASEFGYRFDEKPGREATVRYLANYMTVVMEDKADVAAFAKDLKDSARLYVRINSLTHGRTAVEYPVAGGEGAMIAGFAQCPLAPDKTAKRAGS